jgi:ATP-binding cassette subfamily B protein
MSLYINLTNQFMASFPFYKQFDKMDCAPTCLRMIAKHYGRVLSLQELRSRSFITKQGASLLGISEAAESIGIKSTGVKLSFEKIYSIQLPCIIHWNQNHFVVLYKIKGNVFYTADPAIGKITYTKDEFKHFWTLGNDGTNPMGVALLLEPTPKFYQSIGGVINSLKPMDFLRYLTVYKKQITIVFCCLFLGSIMQLLFPFLTQLIVDRGINAKDVDFIYLILAGQLFLFFSRTTIDFVRRWILFQISTRINIQILSEFLSKLLKLPIAFFDSKLVGDLLQRIDDHSRVEKFLSSSSLSIIFSFLNLIVFGIVLIIYNLKLFVIFSCFSIAYIIYISLFMKKRAEMDYKRFSYLSGNQNAVIQIIHGMAEIKLNNCENKKQNEWEASQREILNLSVSEMKLQQIQDAGSLFINESKNILISFVTALSVIDGQMTLGMMLSVQYIIGQLNAPVNDSINFIRNLQDAKLSLERIQEVHHLEDEQQSDLNRGSLIAVPTHFNIEIKNVSFSYTGLGSNEILNNLNLTIPNGKITAIVGVSGGGKTTLLKLLLKFYNPTNGNIYIDGVDLNSIDSRDWRKHCGVVMQDGYIFPDTIARNIALSTEEVNYTELLNASKLAEIEAYVNSLPLGFNTKIGSNGIGLSQGQKQRLLIARALYKKPKLLFFDEATSSLDSGTEKSILENLSKFIDGRTVVVIAHRLSTVRNADQIVVIDNGAIREKGTHQILTSKKGLYYKLVKNQLDLSLS